MMKPNCLLSLILMLSAVTSLMGQKEIVLNNKKTGRQITIETTRILRIGLDNDTLWACKNFRFFHDSVRFEAKYFYDKNHAVVPNKKDFYIIDIYMKDTIIQLPLSKIKTLECTRKSLEKYYYYRYFNTHRIEPLLVAFIAGGGIAGGISAMLISGLSVPNMAACGIGVVLLSWKLVFVNYIYGTKKYSLNEWSLYPDESGREKKK